MKVLDVVTNRESHLNVFQVDESGKIVDAKFKTFGCGSAIGTL